MKSVNIFSTAVFASARSWHQPIIIWKVHSWKGEEELVWSKEVQWDERHKAGFQNENSHFQALDWELQHPISFPLPSSAISIIQMGGNYPDKYWWASLWEGLRWVLMGHWAGRCELLRNKGLGAQGAVQTRLGVSSPCRESEVVREPSLGLPSYGRYSTDWKLCTDSVFSRRNQKIREDLNCTEILLAPAGFSFPGAATTWSGRLCWSRGFANSDLQIQEPGFQIQWPQAPHLAAGKWESSRPWPQRTSPKWYLLILSVP